MRVKGPFRLILIVLPAIFACVACAPRTYRLPPGKIVYRQEGVASWYGMKFHGRKTSSGERYNMHGLTAAHRTLPLGTIAQVTHRGNGRQVTVKINDRGPFVDGRIIDLSYGAARRLDMVDDGLASVVIEITGGQEGVPSPGTPAIFSIQAGSFLSRENAEALRSSLGERYGSAMVRSFDDGGRTFYRVRVGTFPSEDAALPAMESLKAAGLSPFLVRDY